MFQYLLLPRLPLTLCSLARHCYFFPAGEWWKRESKEGGRNRLWGGCKSCSCMFSVAPHSVVLQSFPGHGYCADKYKQTSHVHFRCTYPLLSSHAIPNIPSEPSVSASVLSVHPCLADLGQLGGSTALAASSSPAMLSQPAIVNPCILVSTCLHLIEWSCFISYN